MTDRTPPATRRWARAAPALGALLGALVVTLAPSGAAQPDPGGGGPRPSAAPAASGDAPSDATPSEGGAWHGMVPVVAEAGEGGAAGWWPTDPIGPPRAPAVDLEPEPPPSALPSLPIDAVAEEAPAPQPAAPAQRPEIVLRTLLGLIALLALAYLGGHRRVQEWERRAGISQVITSGFPFVALGVVASHPTIDVLNDRVLTDLGPVLRLGLGWIGFIVGFRFDARRLQELPREVTAIAATRVTVAFVVIAAAAALVHVGARGFTAAPGLDPSFLRDALVLGAAGVATSRTTPAVLASLGVGRESASAASLIVRVEELAAIVGLCIVAAYFRPHDDGASWQLPGTAWLLLTLGLGLALGVVIYAVMLLRTSSSAEYLVLALGSVSFGAGIAGILRLSPVVVCFVAGVLLANFPGEYKLRLRQTLIRLERPIYFLFLTVVGALWTAGDPTGWVLMAAFVAARLLARAAAMRFDWGGQLVLEAPARRALVFGPMGGLPVAIVVNAGILYPGRSVSWMVTAVLGGAIVSEVLVQLVMRAEAPAAPGPASTPVPGERSSGPHDDEGAA